MCKLLFLMVPCGIWNRCIGFVKLVNYKSRITKGTTYCHKVITWCRSWPYRNLNPLARRKFWSNFRRENTIGEFDSWAIPLQLSWENPTDRSTLLPLGHNELKKLPDGIMMKKLISQYWPLLGVFRQSSSMNSPHKGRVMQSFQDFISVNRNKLLNHQSITHCFGLGHETIMCAVCLSVFLFFSS